MSFALIGSYVNIKNHRSKASIKKCRSKVSIEKYGRKEVKAISNTKETTTHGFIVSAMIHSLKTFDEVIILHENGANDVVAEYKGRRYTGIFNGFVSCYYVDDIYGQLPDQHRCPQCGDYIP